MGCGVSKKKDITAEPEPVKDETGPSEEAEKESAPDAKKQKVQDGAEKPRPQPFAVMRNGHEVIRGMMRDCAAAPDLAAFKETWQRLELWQRLHATTEDGALSAKGIFAMFDERCNNIASEKGLTGVHVPIVSLEQELESQLQNAETAYETVKPVFLKYMEENEAHLKSEEEVMMPCVQQLAKAGTNMAELMQKDVISAIWDHPDFGSFVQYAASTLEKHPEGQPRARVWLHGLMASLPNDRWKQALPFVKAGLSDKLFKEIDAEIGMQA